MKAQIQLPDKLYRRLKAIAKREDCTISEVMLKAAVRYAARFPEMPKPQTAWRFPTIDSGNFLIDPASLSPSADPR